MLGVSTEVYVTPVQGVTNYSLRRVILIVTSRVSTWEKNRTTVLIVVKTFHRKVISCYTYGVYTRERNPTSVLCVTEVLVREVPFAPTSGLCTTVGSGTMVLIAVKHTTVSKTCRDSDT